MLTYIIGCEDTVNDDEDNAPSIGNKISNIENFINIISDSFRDNEIIMKYVKLVDINLLESISESKIKNNSFEINGLKKVILGHLNNKENEIFNIGSINLKEFENYIEQMFIYCCILLLVGVFGRHSAWSFTQMNYLCEEDKTMLMQWCIQEAKCSGIEFDNCSKLGDEEKEKNNELEENKINLEELINKSKELEKRFLSLEVKKCKDIEERMEHDEKMDIKLADLEEKLKTKEDDLFRAMKELNEKNVLIATIREEINFKEKELKEKNTKINGMGNIIDIEKEEWKKESDNLEMLLDKNILELNNREIKIKELEVIIENVNEKNETLRRANNELEKIVQNRGKIIEALEKDLKHIEQESAKSLESNEVEKNMQLNNMKSEIEHIEEELRLSNNELDESIKTIETIRLDNSLTKELFFKIESELEESREENMILNEKNNILMKELKIKDNGMIEISGRKKKIRNTNFNSREELAEKENEKEKEQEKDERQEKEKEQEIKVRFSENLKSREDSNIKHLERFIVEEDEKVNFDSCNKENESGKEFLKNEVNEYIDKSKKFEERCEILENRNIDLKDRVRELEIEIVNISDEKGNMIKECNKLRGKIEEINLLSESNDKEKLLKEMEFKELEKQNYEIRGEIYKKSQEISLLQDKIELLKGLLNNDKQISEKAILMQVLKQFYIRVG